MRNLRWWNFITLNIYWLALNVASNSLHPIILPVKVQQLVPANVKATYLGFLTFAGLVVAIVVQPVMGALSDRSASRFGRRRPFIVAGTLMNLAFLMAVGLSRNYWILLAALLLLQFSSNTAHGPLQGLIPDQVPAKQRGSASGAKGLIEILGAVTASLASGYLVERGHLMLAIGLVMAVFTVAMVITVLAVREERWTGTSDTPLWSTVLGTFKIDLRQHRDYAWWLLNRFLFFVGLTVIQSFILYFIQDVVGLEKPAEATGMLTAVLGVGILLVVFPSGYLADRVGRKPLLVAAGLGAMVGGLLFPWARSMTQLIIYGGMIGLCAGVFISAGWAMATDLVPHEEAGRYLGVSNLATAGGSAIARLGGPFIDLFNARQAGLGYTVVLTSCGLAFLLATLVVLKVREGKRKVAAEAGQPGTTSRE